MTKALTLDEARDALALFDRVLHINLSAAIEALIDAKIAIARQEIAVEASRDCTVTLKSIRTYAQALHLAGTTPEARNIGEVLLRILEPHR